MEEIATYYYFHGAGTRPNRAIEFYRENGELKTRSKSCKDGEWIVMSDISNTDIKVEQQSSSEKVKLILEARDKRSFFPDIIKNKTMNELSKEEQDTLIHKLEPDGGWRLELYHDYSSGKVVVKELTFFNPN